MFSFVLYKFSERNQVIVLIKTALVRKEKEALLFKKQKCLIKKQENELNINRNLIY